MWKDRLLSLKTLGLFNAQTESEDPKFRCTPEIICKKQASDQLIGMLNHEITVKKRNVQLVGIEGSNLE